MAGAKVKVDLEYRENGEIKKHEFEISFISYYHIQEFGKIQTIINDVISLQIEFNDNTDTIEAGNGEIDQLLTRNEEIAQILRGKAESDPVRMRIDLIIRILKDNMIQGRYIEFDFWSELVGIQEQTLFLESMIRKDIDKKKEVVTA
jgi:hypothetical protein